MEIICYSCGRGEYPENTISAIAHCQKINPDWRIEMDVQISSDGHLILFHDNNTKRVTGEDKLINELQLSEIKELNAGYSFSNNSDNFFRLNPVRIPELEEVFTTFPNAKILLDIHTNNPLVIDKIISLIELKFKEGDFVIVSEYDEVISKLRSKKPCWVYGVPEMEAKRMLYSSFFFLDSLFPIKSDILMLPQKYGVVNVLNERVLAHAKKRNKPIWAWKYEGAFVTTITSLEEVISLKNRGVSGIFTEYPEKLFNELSEYPKSNE